MIRSPLCLALFTLAACGPASMPVDGGADALTPPFRDLGPEPDAAPGITATTAVVTTADFVGGTGTLATIALADQKVTKAIDNTLGADNFARTVAGKLYVLLRPNGPLRIYDPATGFKMPVEYKLDNGGNPHDVMPIPASSKIYITMYNADAGKALAVLDLAKPGAPLSYVALPQAMADKDGKPEANDLHFCAGLLYVGLQDLSMFKPSGPGRIAVVDPAKDMVVGTIQLAGPNPNGFALDGAGCDRVLVAAAGDQFGPLDGKGGIERVDLSLRKSLGLVIKDSDLKGHPSTIASHSPSLAFSVLSVAGGSQVVAIDPQAGKLLSSVLPKAGFASFAAVSPDGQLFVGVQSPDAMTKQPSPGVWVGPAVGDKFVGRLVDVGQGPYAIAFY